MSDYTTGPLVGLFNKATGALVGAFGQDGKEYPILVGAAYALSAQAAVAITGGTITSATLGSTGAPCPLYSTNVWSNGYFIAAPAARVVDTTAALASATIAAGKQTTFLATPAAGISSTMAAGTDGERRRIVFGAATTVTWVSTVAAGTKTVFAAGESIELIYNAVAGTPANSAATTWYPF